MGRPRHPLLALATFALLFAGGALAGCGEKDESPVKKRPGPEVEVPPLPEPTAPPLAKRPGAAPGAPNVLVVMADDQSLASFKRRYMPKTFRDIVDPGTLFTSGLAVPPLCCPSRAGFLTGQYPHNHGVYSNKLGYLQLRHPEQVLPAYLQRAGYITGFAGKPPNGYNRLRTTKPSPGFDRWYASYDGRINYYDYDLSINGKVESYGIDRSDYLTDVLTGHGLDFISEAARGKRPFFLWMSQYTPHRHGPPEAIDERIPSCTGSVPVPRSEGEYRRYADVPLPKPASWSEEDVDDKQKRIADLPKIGRNTEESATNRWRCTLASLRALDDSVGTMVDRLRELGELDDTVIVYVSDNGYFFGEHRLDNGKSWYYREGSEVPMAIRVPPSLAGAGAPATSDELAATIDLAPTFLDYAQARPCIGEGVCRPPDGHSLRGILEGQGGTLRRGALLELAAGCTAYEAIRTQRYLLSVPPDDAEAKCDLGPELYDLAKDPDELENVFADERYAKVREDLVHRINRLARCEGTKGPAACE